MVECKFTWSTASAAAFLLRVREPGDQLLYYASEEYGIIELAERIWQKSLPLTFAPLGVYADKDYASLIRNDMQVLASTDNYHILTSESSYWPVEKFQRFHQVNTQKSTTSCQNPARPMVPPIALWIRGKLEYLPILTSWGISIVGTRAPSSYGRRVTDFFAHTIAQSNITIISGGALGIDGIAHMCSVRQQQPSIAVLAGGVDVPSPKTNSEIFRELLTCGLLVSEYPPGYTPVKHRFLIRNRIIAALGEVLLVTEAPQRSGALNTAWWAEQLHIPIASIPGAIGSGDNRGNLLLLRDHQAVLCIEPGHCMELMPYAFHYSRSLL